MDRDTGNKVTQVRGSIKTNSENEEGVAEGGRASWGTATGVRAMLRKEKDMSRELEVPEAVEACRRLDRGRNIVQLSGGHAASRGAEGLRRMPAINKKMNYG